MHFFAKVTKLFYYISFLMNPFCSNKFLNYKEIEQEWTMKKTWMDYPHGSLEFQVGIQKFLRFAFADTHEFMKLCH